MGKNLLKTGLASVVYICFAVYLFQPYFKHFSRIQYLIVINICFASAGCFLLSRRWVGGFFASFFAGAIYGFGPFVLGLATFHPTVGSLAAIIPWLFCPAAYYHKEKWQWKNIALTVLPFLAIVLFFQVSAKLCLFAIPIQVKPELVNLGGLLAPLVMAKRSIIGVGFYHIPVAPLVIGFSMLVVARRYGVIIILMIGMVLAFCNSFLNVSPLIWWTIPVLCGSILIGSGIQGLVCAGQSDRKWVLSSAILLAVLAIVTLLLATKYFQAFAGLADGYANLLVKTAQIYVIGMVAVAIIFFMTRAEARLHWPRWFLLCGALALDVFTSARFIVDSIF